MEFKVSAAVENTYEIGDTPPTTEVNAVLSSSFTSEGYVSGESKLSNGGLTGHDGITSSLALENEESHPTIEPSTADNAAESSKDSTANGSEADATVKVTTANITISRTVPKRKVSITLPKSQYEAGIEVNFADKINYFSESQAAGQIPGLTASVLDNSKPDDADKDHEPQAAVSGNSYEAAGAEVFPTLVTSQAPSLSASVGDDGSFGIGAGGYRQPQFEGGEIENEPEVRLDVVRESDQHAEEELPEQGLARSLLSHFKDIEAEAQHTKQKEHRPSGVAVKATPTPLRPAVRTDDNDSNYSHGPPAQERAEVENEPIVRTDVVKESDSNVAEELPERGMARNLLSKFKTLEVEAKQRSDYKPSGASVRVVSDAHVARAGVQTWKGSPARSTSAEPHREPVFEGGDVENTPQVRTDVVRESDSNIGEELPEPGLAQSLLSRFKTLESEATKKSEYKPSGVANKATPSKMHIMAGRSTYIPDGTTKGGNVDGAEGAVSGSAAFEPQFEGGEFENTPEVRSDVIRESDRILEEDLPQQGLAKNLLSRFKSIEAEASVKKDYVPSGVGSKPTPTPLGLAATAVGIRRPASLHDGSSDSRGASSERDHTPSSYGEFEGSAVNGGEYENVPAPRPDGVIGASDHDERDELPESGLAQSMLSKFKSLESQKITDYQPSGVGSKAADDPAALVGTAHSEHNVAAGLSQTLHLLHRPGFQATASCSGSSYFDRLEETTETGTSAVSAAALYADDELYTEAGQNRPAIIGSRSTYHEPEQAVTMSPAPVVCRAALVEAVSSEQSVHAYTDLSSPTSWTGSIRAVADDITNDHCAAAESPQSEVSVMLHSFKVEGAAASPPESSTLHAVSTLLPDPPSVYLPASADECSRANAETMAFLSPFASDQLTCTNPACSPPTAAFPMSCIEPPGNAALVSSFASCITLVDHPTINGLCESSPNEIVRPSEAEALVASLKDESQLECGSKLHSASSISPDSGASTAGTDCGIQRTSFSSDCVQQYASCCNDSKTDNASAGKFMPVAAKSRSVTTTEFFQSSDVSGWQLGTDLSCSHGDTDVCAAKTDDQPFKAALFGKSEIACRCSELDGEAALCPGVILDVLTYGSAAADLCSLCAIRQNKCDDPVNSVQSVSPASSIQAAPDLLVLHDTKSGCSRGDFTRSDELIGCDSLPQATSDHTDISSSSLVQVQLGDNSHVIFKEPALADRTQLAVSEAATAKVHSDSIDDWCSPARSPLHAALPLSLMLPTICNGVILRPAVNSSQDTEPLIRVGSPHIDTQVGVADIVFGATDDNCDDSRQANPECGFAEEHEEVVCLTMMPAEPGLLPCLLSEGSTEQPSGQLNVTASDPPPVESFPKINISSYTVADSAAVLGDMEEVADKRRGSAVSHSTNTEGAEACTELKVAHGQLLPNQAKSHDAAEHRDDEAAHLEPHSSFGNRDTEGQARTASTSTAGDIVLGCSPVLPKPDLLLNTDQPVVCSVMSVQKSDKQILSSGVASTLDNAMQQEGSNENYLLSGSDGRSMVQIETNPVTTLNDLPSAEYRTSVCTKPATSYSSALIDHQSLSLDASSTLCAEVPASPPSGSPGSSGMEAPPCSENFEATYVTISSDGSAYAEFLSSRRPNDDSSKRVAATLPIIPEPLLSLGTVTALSAVTVQADSNVQLRSDDVAQESFLSIACPGFSTVPGAEAEKQHVAGTAATHDDQGDSSNPDCVLTSIFSDERSFNINLSYSAENERVTTPEHSAIPGLAELYRLDGSPSVDPCSEKPVDTQTTTASQVVCAAFNSLQEIASHSSVYQQSIQENSTFSMQLDCTPDQQPLCSASDTRSTSDDTNARTGAPERFVTSPSTVVVDATANIAPDNQLQCVAALSKNDSVTLTSQATTPLLQTDSGDKFALLLPVHSGSPLQTDEERLPNQLAAASLAPAEPSTAHNTLCILVDVCDSASGHSLFDAEPRLLCATNAIVSRTSAQHVSQCVEWPSMPAALSLTVSSMPPPAVLEEGVEPLPALQPPGYGNMEQKDGVAKKSGATYVDINCRQSTDATGVKKSDLAASVVCSSSVETVLPSQAVESFPSGSNLTDSQKASLEARTMHPSEAAAGNDVAEVTVFPALDAVSWYRCSDRPPPHDSSNKDSFGLSSKENATFANDGTSSRAVTESNTDCRVTAGETSKVPAGQTTREQDG